MSAVPVMEPPKPSKAEQFFRETLPSVVPGIEIREEQIKMARAVERGIQEESHVISEAGTGTGKSLAYLVPVAQHLQEHPQSCAVISTGTIALQEQILGKDIPDLEKVLGYSLNAELAKGKGNYLCWTRLQEQVQELGLFDEDNPLGNVFQWAQNTCTGDKTELPVEALPVWMEVNCDDNCVGKKKCRNANRCFRLKAKERLESADVVVTNHTLFILDLKLREETMGEHSILPDFDVVVLDEAHNLEPVAVKIQGLQVSQYRIPQILSQLKKCPGSDPSSIREASMANEAFFFTVSMAGNGKIDKFYIPKTADGEPLAKMMDSLEDLRKAVDKVGKMFDPQGWTDRVDGLFQRLTNAIIESESIIYNDSLDDVSWVEVTHDKHQRKKVTIHLTPVDVSEKLEQLLFSNEEIRSVIMTSATISTAGSFDYFKKSVGCQKAIELQVQSPFDYKRQCLMYLPSGLPDALSRDFHTLVVPEIEKILQVTQGRAFVLFTSYKGMNEAFNVITSRPPDKRLPYRIFKQGEVSKQRLLDMFREDEHSILFATSSFWEGVSVEGSALSCVILVKLPFGVPDEPVVEAKVKAIERRGGRSFNEYSLPECIIKMKQGFGRLIRTRSDRGIVAILDPRVRAKGYGWQILSSLPPAQEIRSLVNVDLFLEGK
ncbi:DEAD/DEAH box helicase [Heliobacterium chlorum]|uniref:DEAD/DEAH box helicase n=1 Tax=Heliobacterium chlorum TaxID=2698 RepID=A0ABR7T1U7_HELCL|nr:helicase C-terminal domain-containing protein [Heliobacterium chlorum]MBC9783501.1 DEAD/DEAH box helicase [Heliobacterium chlorum]